MRATPYHANPRSPYPIRNYETRKSLLAVLINASLDAAAQMFIFPTTYGPSDKYQVVDTAKYEITYQIAAKLNPNPKYSHVAYKDTQILLIGKRISATYSRELLKAREKADAEIKQGAETVDSFSDITFPEDVFKGYPKPGALTTSYRLFLSAGYGQYNRGIARLQVADPVGDQEDPQLHVSESSRGIPWEEVHRLVHLRHSPL